MLRKTALFIVPVLASFFAHSQSIEIPSSIGLGEKVRLRFNQLPLSVNGSGEEEEVVTVPSCTGFTFSDAGVESNYLNYYNMSGNSFGTIEDAITALEGGNLRLYLNDAHLDTNVYPFPCDVGLSGMHTLFINGYNESNYVNVSNYDFLSGIKNLIRMRLYNSRTASDDPVESSALDSIETISSYLNIESSRLTNDFTSLQTVSDLSITDTAGVMDRFPSFPSLTNVDFNVGLSFLAGTLEGLNAVSSNLNSVSIGNNSGDADLLNSVPDIYQLYVGNNSFNTFNSFNALDYVGFINISGNNFSSDTLSGLFPMLGEVYNSFSISGNTFQSGGVVNVGGGSPLILTTLDFSNNVGLEAVTGFNSLMEFNQIRFAYSYGVVSNVEMIDGFNFDESSDGNGGLVFLDTPNLRTFSGFSNITSLGTLSLGAKSLSSISAFPDLQSIGSLNLRNYPFTDLTASFTQNLSSINNLNIITEDGEALNIDDLGALSHISSMNINFIFEDANIGDSVDMGIKLSSSSPLCQGISAGTVVVSKRRTTYAEGFNLGSLVEQYTPEDAAGYICQ